MYEQRGSASAIHALASADCKILDSSWHHFVMRSKKASTIELFLDGGQIATAGTTANTNYIYANTGNVWGIGLRIDRPDLDTWEWDWAMADIRVYNTSLSNAAILNITNYGEPGGPAAPPEDPRIFLYSPQNDSRTNIATVDFYYNASCAASTSLKNISLYIDGVYNRSNTSAVVNNANSSFQDVYLGLGSTGAQAFTWSVKVEDMNSNTNTSNEYDLTIIQSPKIFLYSPQNATLLNSSTVDFYYNASIIGVSPTNTYILNTSLYINGVYNRSNTSAVVNNANSSFQNIDFQEGTYRWSIKVHAKVNGFTTVTYGLNENSSLNHTFYMDLGAPLVSDNFREYYTSSYNLELNITDAYPIDFLLVDNCSNSFSNSSVVTPFNFNKTINFSSCGLGQKETNVSVCDSLGNCNNQTFYWESMGRINVSGKVSGSGAAINTFSVFVNGSYYGGTTTGTLFVNNLSKGFYNLTFSAPGYSSESSVVEVSAQLNQKQFTVYSSNSINIYIRKETDGTNISENITIRFYSDTFGEFTNFTESGYFFIADLNASEWLLTFLSANYSTRTYTLTVSENSSQTLNAYLAKNTSTVLFSVTDKDDSSLYLSNVLTTMYRFISGSWKPVESKYTDVTGQVELGYLEDQNYKFYLSKTGYKDYIFYLNPVLYSTYNLQMEKTTLINFSQDYDKIALIYAPKAFENNKTVTFSFLIQSPYGELINYGYTITYPGGTDTQIGTNSLGEQLSSSVTITGATMIDRVELFYYYETTTSGHRNFTAYLPIGSVDMGNNTMIANRDKTYGLTTFERSLIVTFIVIFIVGIATLVGQTIPGVLLAFGVEGYLVYIGFISFWAVGLQIVLGIFLISWKSGG